MTTVCLSEIETTLPVSILPRTLTCPWNGQRASPQVFLGGGTIRPAELTPLTPWRACPLSFHSSHPQSQSFRCPAAEAPCQSLPQRSSSFLRRSLSSACPRGRMSL